MNFWQGIVEDNKTDPLKMGRVKIRIFGVHTPSKSVDEDNNFYSVDDLPWAIPAYPITSPTISEECGFAVPQQGSVVVGFFIDRFQQIPVYMATLPKMVAELPDFTKGFSDPTETYPTSDSVNRSPISRLATGEEAGGPIIANKKTNVKSGDAGNGATFNEPPTPYATTYPKNKVIQTESGHAIEIDDTPGATRIHVYHKSGTFTEMHDSGTKVDKTTGNHYDIILGDENVLVEGAKKVHVKGAQNTRIEGPEYREVDSNQTVEISGVQNIHVVGNTNVTCDATVNITAAAHVNIDGGSSDMSGIVTQKCICPFTGKMHSDYSGDVYGSK